MKNVDWGGYESWKLACSVFWKIKKGALFLQTVCNFTDGALVQHQEWDGKESTITRKLQDGKLVVVSAKQLMCSWVLFYIHSSHNCSMSLIDPLDRAPQRSPSTMQTTQPLRGLAALQRVLSFMDDSYIHSKKRLWQDVHHQVVHYIQLTISGSIYHFRY